VTLLLDRLFTADLLFLIVATPFAFGTVQAWAYSAMEAVIFGLVIVWMIKRAMLAHEQNQVADKIRNSKSEIRNCALPLVRCAICYHPGVQRMSFDATGHTKTETGSRFAVKRRSSRFEPRKEIDGIWWHAVRMRGRVLGEGFGRFSETIRGQAMRNDKDTVMRASFIIELQRNPDKVVAVPRHETALLQSSAFELLEVRKSFCPNLVSADSIEPLATEPFCNSLAQIFIQVIPQERSWTNDG